jgi:hypothetical protein
MVFNDSPFTGRIDDPLRMKQKSAVSAPFEIKFDGDSANVHHFKQNIKIRMEHNGLTNEFLVRLGEKEVQPTFLKPIGRLMQTGLLLAIFWTTTPTSPWTKSKPNATATMPSSVLGLKSRVPHLQMVWP